MVRIMFYMMLNPESDNPMLEESDSEGDIVRVWAASAMIPDDFSYLEVKKDIPDVAEFLTAVDCWRTNALFG